jgi:predicted membrane protein
MPERGAALVSFWRCQSDKQTPLELSGCSGIPISLMTYFAPIQNICRKQVWLATLMELLGTYIAHFFDEFKLIIHVSILTIEDFAI